MSNEDRAQRLAELELRYWELSGLRLALLVDEHVRGTTDASTAYTRIMRQIADVAAEMERLGPPLRVVAKEGEEEEEPW